MSTTHHVPKVSTLWLVFLALFVGTIITVAVAYFDIGLLNRPELWALTLLVVAVACAGKLGGAALAARACGVPWRDCGAIGVLMNTRGLMELVILNVGRELGVITPAVFAMMVIMALVTTFLTTPLLNVVLPRRLYTAAEPAPARGRRGFSVLIPVAHPGSAAVGSARKARSTPVAHGSNSIGEWPARGSST